MVSLRRFAVKPIKPARVGNSNFWLGSEAEQLADEESLADHIPFCQASHSALPDHLHGFDSLQRPPRALKRTIAFGQPNSFLYCPVVLFDHVIEILALA